MSELDFDDFFKALKGSGLMGAIERSIVRHRDPYRAVSELDVHYKLLGDQDPDYYKMREAQESVREQQILSRARRRIALGVLGFAAGSGLVGVMGYTCDRALAAHDRNVIAAHDRELERYHQVASPSSNASSALGSALVSPRHAHRDESSKCIHWITIKVKSDWGDGHLHPDESWCECQRADGHLLWGPGTCPVMEESK